MHLQYGWIECHQHCNRMKTHVRIWPHWEQSRGENRGGPSSEPCGTTVEMFACSRSGSYPFKKLTITMLCQKKKSNTPEDGLIVDLCDCVRMDEDCSQFGLSSSMIGPNGSFFVPLWIQTGSNLEGYYRQNRETVVCIQNVQELKTKT